MRCTLPQCRKEGGCSTLACILFLGVYTIAENQFLEDGRPVNEQPG
jgi:hypothetical protein